MRAVGIVLVLISMPVIWAWLKSFPDQRKWAYAAIGFLPLTINALNLDAALISWSTWAGYAKGVILTLLDTLALAILWTRGASWRGVPLLGPILFYLAAVALSAAFSSLFMSSFFYIFQVVRMTIVFLAVATVVSHSRAPHWLCVGLSAGAIFQFFVSLHQRFSGDLQASGTLGHQNLLGLMLECSAILLLSYMLAGGKSKLVAAGFGAALLTLAFGASRGAIGFTALGIALLLGLSLARHATARKWKVIGTATLALALAAPVMIDGLERRFESVSGPGDYDERAAFNTAAKMMWRDHPFGVGANQYALTANLGGYSARAGVIPTEASRSAQVHNAYLLVAAETGWLGLIAFVILLFTAIITGIRYSFKLRPDSSGDFVLGATVAIAVVSVHNAYEWVLLTYQAQYMFAISLGIIAGMRRARLVGSTGTIVRGGHTATSAQGLVGNAGRD